MLQNNPFWLAPILVFSSLLTACTASNDTTRFYTLKPATSRILNNNVDSDSHSISIESLTIPRLLNRPQIVSRIGNNEIRRAEYHQWGGSVVEEIKQLLIYTLNQELSNTGDYVSPSDSRSRPDYNLYLDINRLDGQLGEEAMIELTWLLESDRDHQLSARGTVRHTTQIESHQYRYYVETLQSLIIKSAQTLSEQLAAHMANK